MMAEIQKEREYDTSKGKQWIDEYNNLLIKANSRKQELQNLISLYDLQEQDILHYIEMKKCDAIISSKLMKKLKEVTTERRTSKEEFGALNSITMLSKKSKYQNNETYTFRTNVIVDLLEEGHNE